MGVHPCCIVDEFLMKSYTRDEIHVCEEHHVGGRVVQGEVPQDVHRPVHLSIINQSVNQSTNQSNTPTVNQSTNNQSFN